MKEHVRAHDRFGRTGVAGHVTDHRPLRNRARQEHRVQFDAAIDRGRGVQARNRCEPTVLQLRLVDGGKERVVADICEQLDAGGSHGLADLRHDRLGETDQDVLRPARRGQRADRLCGADRGHLRQGLRARVLPGNLRDRRRRDARQDQHRKDTTRGHRNRAPPRAGIAQLQHGFPPPFSVTLCRRTPFSLHAGPENELATHAGIV